MKHLRLEMLNTTWNTTWAVRRQPRVAWSFSGGARLCAPSLKLWSVRDRRAGWNAI